LGAPVRCNYFDNSDNNKYIGVGEDPTGEENIQYDDWLTVEPNEDYVLLINNFSNNNSGFSIQFSGTLFVEFPNTALDCSIIDNLLGPPIIACDNGDSVILDAATSDALAYEWYLDMGMGFQRIPAENGPSLIVAVSAMYRVLVVMPSGNNIISETQVAYAPSPITYQLTNETVCLDDTIFDLGSKDSEALGDQSSNEFRVTYHESMQDALDGLHALDKEFVSSVIDRTIFVRTTSLADNSCFDASQSFQIFGVELPILDFETEVFICGNSTEITIGEEVADPNFLYEWDSGETTSQIIVRQEGVYRLSVTNAEESLQCVTVRSVNVSFSRIPVIEDITIEYAEDGTNKVNVYLEENGEFDFQLDNENRQREANFQNLIPGSHTITVHNLDGCGAVSQEIVVVGFPKYFTPNADGYNDNWNVSGLSFLENPVITIFDRYGKLIYQLTENSDGWDGTLNGEFLPEADYWFKLVYTDSNGQNTTAKYVNNHFTLKR